MANHSFTTTFSVDQSADKAARVTGTAINWTMGSLDDQRLTDLLTIGQDSPTGKRTGT